MSDQKRASLRIHQEQPLNAGPPPAELVQEFITPTEGFFTRNHGPIPQIAPDSYRLSINGLVDRPAQLTLSDLQRFPQVRIDATLQCAGLRRSELLSVRPIPGELPWGSEPIGTATWDGVLLADVLETVGVQAEARHAAFVGLDQVERRGQVFGFGGSIPLDIVPTHDVVLACGMNGAPLTPLHGAPLRVVVPGYIGARSVKWLGAISLQAAPSDNYFQQLAYKVFPPHIGAAEADWSKGEMLGELPLNAVICTPDDGATLASGLCRIAGYAISSAERPITHVEVSIDGGKQWQLAQLSTGSRWTWRLWRIDADLPPGQHWIIVRAIDASGATQPADLADTWNVKGYNNNAWHRITIIVHR